MQQLNVETNGATRRDTTKGGDDIIAMMHVLCQRAEEIWGRRIGYEMTSRQYVVLEAVARNPCAKQAVLVAETSIDRSTLSDLVRRLVEHGFLVRKRSKEDARAWEVTLSQKARTV